MTDNISKPTAAYTALTDKCTLPIALMGGTAAMQDAGETYLPREVVINDLGQEEGESSTAYAKRLDRTILFNAYRDAIQTLRGKIFSKPIILSEDSPDALKEFAGDVDGNGKSLTRFSFDLFEDCLNTGLSYILIDFPTITDTDTRSKADDTEQGIRPYFVHLKAADVLDPPLPDGKLPHAVRVYSSETVMDDNWEETTVERIRVLRADTFEVYQKNSDGEYRLIDEGVNTLGLIPLVPVFTDQTGPPLIDLAYKNLEHWQSSSDQRHILHVARVPILFGKGWLESSSAIEVGPNRLITNQSEQASLEFVEHSGAAIDAGRQDLVDIEQAMEVLSLKPMMPRSGTATATATAIDTAQADSLLQAWGNNLENGLEQALDIMALWANIGDVESDVTVNGDFGLSLTGTSEADILQKSQLSGQLSLETYLQELKRRNILHDSVDVTEELLMIEAEEPVAAPVGVLPEA
ncbi:MAG: DUF4055 domain-containing protein [Planctomycetes bacterium]|nr:DUF4055 domain-containing protein [Planctomycetota bacterium]